MMIQINQQQQQPSAKSIESMAAKQNSVSNGKVLNQSSDKLDVSQSIEWDESLVQQVRTRQDSLTKSKEFKQEKDTKYDNENDVKSTVWQDAQKTNNNKVYVRGVQHNETTQVNPNLREELCQEIESKLKQLDQLETKVKQYSNTIENLELCTLAGLQMLEQLCSQTTQTQSHESQAKQHINTMMEQWNQFQAQSWTVQLNCESNCISDSEEMQHFITLFNNIRLKRYTGPKIPTGYTARQLNKHKSLANSNDVRKDLISIDFKKLHKHISDYIMSVNKENASQEMRKNELLRLKKHFEENLGIFVGEKDEEFALFLTNEICKLFSNYGSLMWYPSCFQLYHKTVEKVFLFSFKGYNAIFGLSCHTMFDNNGNITGYKYAGFPNGHIIRFNICKAGFLDYQLNRKLNLI